MTLNVASFADVNSTIRFLKPELRLFLRDLTFQLPDQSFFDPQTFLSLIDIENIEWKWGDRLTFYRENFTDTYDIIECSVSQLDTVTPLCNSGSVIVLIIHANGKEKDLDLRNLNIRYYIIVGDIERFYISKQDVNIYHKKFKQDFEVSFRTGLKDDPIDIRALTDFTIGYETRYPIDDVAIRENQGLYRPPGAPLYKNESGEVVWPLIRSYGKVSFSGQENREDYSITEENKNVINTKYASIVASLDEGVEIISLSGKGDDLTVIVHGRMRRSEYKEMIRFDSGKVKILFPDMSQDEVDSIRKEPSILFGNDRVFENISEFMATPIELYLEKRLTFAEQIIYPKIMTERNLQRAMIEGSRTRFRKTISHIDNYFSTLSLKYPNDHFNLMVTKYTAYLEELPENRRVLALLMQRNNSLYKLVAEIRSRLEKESRLVANKRNFMLSRIEELMKNQNNIFPYLEERSVGNPTLLEEQRFLANRVFGTIHDPRTVERTHYHLQDSQISGTQYIIKGVDYAYITGNNFDCIIEDCGFVIVVGTGIIRVSGCIHSLVSYSSSIQLDNISKMPFGPDIFLYMENGSVYDTMKNYSDNIAPKTIDELFDPRQSDKENILTAPAVDLQRYTFYRSVIKNLYVTSLPTNCITAMIQNIINLGADDE
jgi:hypothetical protein